MHEDDGQGNADAATQKVHKVALGRKQKIVLMAYQS